MNININSIKTINSLSFIGYLILIIFLLDCGDKNRNNGTPPIIKLIRFQSPNPLGIGQESIVIRGTVSFVDPDGDVVSINKFIKENGSNKEFELYSEDDQPTDNVNGLETAEISITITLKFDNPIKIIKSYTIKIIVVDSLGHESDPSLEEIVICPSGPEAIDCPPSPLI